MAAALRSPESGSFLPGPASRAHGAVPSPRQRRRETDGHSWATAPCPAGGDRRPPPLGQMFAQCPETSPACAPGMSPRSRDSALPAQPTARRGCRQFGAKTLPGARAFWVCLGAQGTEQLLFSPSSVCQRSGALVQPRDVVDGCARRKGQQWEAGPASGAGGGTRVARAGTKVRSAAHSAAGDVVPEGRGDAASPTQGCHRAGWAAGPAEEEEEEEDALLGLSSHLTRLFLVPPFVLGVAGAPSLH